MAEFIMISESLVVKNLVVEHLLVIEHPETKGTVEDWCTQKNVYCCSVQRFIKHRRLLVRVSHLQSLNKVEHNEREKCDGEEDGHACSEHEGDEDDVHDERVLVMDHILWTAV